MELGKMDIILAKPNCVYAPGEIMEGRLEIDLPVPKKIRGIYIKFNGEGGVRYHNLLMASNGGKTHNVLAYADEKYIHHKQHCLRNAGSSGTLAPGKHIYPFSYHLPYVLPSTFQHEYGTIRYFLKAVMEQSRGFKQRYFKDFIVRSFINLNLYPTLQDFYSVTLLKKSSLFWVSSVKLRINVKVPKTGYTSGETMFLYTEVLNTCDRDIEDITFEFRKHTQFYAQAPKRHSKVVTSILAKSNLGFQPARCLQSYNHKLAIPIFSHEIYDGSTIICVSYHLKITARRGHNDELTERIPITMGFWSTQRF